MSEGKMSEAGAKAVSALDGKLATGGFAAVREAGLQGMITLRGDLASASVKAAVQAAAGVEVPGQRRIATQGERGAGWMSPDELLILVPYGAVRDTVAGLTEALKGEHALVADVSDARAMFRISGPKADQVLRKLCPVDFDGLAEGELRRTRAAQVAAALWRSGPEEFTLVSFRSVAGYVFGALEMSARAGAELA